MQRVVCAKSLEHPWWTSLFSVSLPHRTPQMAVVGQKWNDDFVTEEGNNFHKCGSFQGNSDDISSCIDVGLSMF
jgi:hypothetical protein